MSKVVEKYSQSKIKSDKLMGTGARLSTVVDKYLPDDAYVQKQSTEIKGANAYITTFRNSSVDNETGILKKGDKIRDSHSTGYKSILHGIANFIETDPAVAKPALKILNVLDTIDESKSYIVQNVATDKALKKFEEPDYVTAIEESGTLIYFNLFKNSHLEFINLYNTMISEDAKKEYSSVKESLIEIKYRANALITYIDSRAHDDGGIYMTVAKEMNEIIKDAMIPVKAEDTRKKDKEEGTPPDGNESTES